MDMIRHKTNQKIKRYILSEFWRLKQIIKTVALTIMILLYIFSCTTATWNTSDTDTNTIRRKILFNF